MTYLLPSPPLISVLIMLKKAMRCIGPWAIALGFMAALPSGAARAALFEQEDVDPEKFIAVAVPLPQGNRYNLIVLEQKSDSRLCWEDAGEAGVINPLLLTFDFSGICGRSTDSNGYSIRQVGEDLALKYRLSLQKKDGVLVLMGMPLQASYGQPMEIGRTQVLSDGFLKISLNPDWRFTRRAYQGQPLGHIYFTRDVVPSDPEPSAETNIAAQSSEIEDRDESVAIDSSQGGAPRETSIRDNDATPIEDPSGQGDVAVPVEGPQLLEGPIQIPVPAPPSPSGQLNTTEPVSDSPLAPMTPIPVPTIAPLGQVGESEPDVFSNRDLGGLPQVDSAGDPPPPPFNIARSIQRYRIYVSAQDAAGSDAIKTLAPDSFWTSYQGQRVLQVGAFLDKSKADWMMNELGQQGINGIIDASAY